MRKCLKLATVWNIEVMFHNFCVGNLYYKLLCIDGGLKDVKFQLIRRTSFSFNSNRQSCDVVPQNYANTWTNGAESHFRGAGTMFRPNYCATLRQNSSLTKHNLVRNLILFLSIIMVEHLSVESPTLLFLDWNYVNISVVLTLRFQIV